MSHPGLTRDAVTVRRPGAATDAEGNPTAVPAVVTMTRGTWGSPSARDLSRAAQRGQSIDAVVALASTVDVQAGDLVDVRGETWTAVGVVDARIHKRVLLRRTS